MDTFNPRSYKRSDSKFVNTNEPEYSFQSTLLQEERQGAIFLSSNSPSFQSTLLQEERQEIVADFLSLYAFNPRSYKRSDMLRYHKILIHFHFQSTLLQEERPFSRQLMRTQ